MHHHRSIYTIGAFLVASRPVVESFLLFPNLAARHLVASSPTNADVHTPTPLTESGSIRRHCYLPLNSCALQMQSSSASDGSTANSRVDAGWTDMSNHKIAVLEDVVKRLQEQKTGLTNELLESESMTRDLEANLTRVIKRARETTSAELEKHQIQVHQLHEKLKEAEDAKSRIKQKCKEQLETAQQNAIETHERLDAKAKNFESLLESAQSKLDKYRKECFERESDIRQSLRNEQEARKKLEVLNSDMAEQLAEAKAEMAQQKQMIEDTLMISEAAVSAAERREVKLKQSLKDAKDRLESLEATAIYSSQKDEKSGGTEKQSTTNRSFADTDANLPIPSMIEFPHDSDPLLVHEYFMKIAVEEAREASIQGEVPIGAVVVKNMTSQDEPADYMQFQVLSTGRNSVEADCDASAHAELTALRRASRRIKNWRLLNCTLYSTLEPCPTCLSACQAFRLPKLVYGAPDLRLGAVHTHIKLLEVEHPFHNVSVAATGVMKEECADMMRSFFRDRRRSEDSTISLRGQGTGADLHDGIPGLGLDDRNAVPAKSSALFNKRQPGLFRRIRRKLLP